MKGLLVLIIIVILALYGNCQPPKGSIKRFKEHKGGKGLPDLIIESVTWKEHYDANYGHDSIHQSSKDPYVYFCITVYNIGKIPAILPLSHTLSIYKGKISPNNIVLEAKPGSQIKILPGDCYIFEVVSIGYPIPNLLKRNLGISRLIIRVDDLNIIKEQREQNNNFKFYILITN